MSRTALKTEAAIAPARNVDGRPSGRWQPRVLCDGAVCIMAIAVSVQLLSLPMGGYWDVLTAEFFALPITLALLAIWGSYSSVRVWKRELPALLVATAAGFTVAEAMAELVMPKSGEVSAAILLGWVLTLAAFFLARYAQQAFFHGRFEASPSPVVMLGSAKNTKHVYHSLAEDISEQGVTVAAVFADGVEAWPEATSQNVVVNDTKWAKSFAECCDIQCGIVIVPAECDKATAELVEKCALIFKYLYVAPQITQERVTTAALKNDGGSFEIQVGDCAAPSENHFLKRVVDMAGAVTLCLLTLPFFMLAGLAIWLTSDGPIFYKQVRIGKGNRLFFALKFRTMFVDAGERLAHCLEKDPTLRAQWESVHKLKNDPRVTTVGRFLRRFSLDELPQIWNVLMGDMSLIGPRPIVVSEIERYGLDYTAYEAVRPGLTGLWQVSGRNDTTYQQRVDYDAYYVKNWTPGLDIRIIMRTFRAVISGVGAY